MTDTAVKENGNGKPSTAVEGAAVTLPDGSRHPDYKIGIVDILDRLIHHAPIDEVTKREYHDALADKYFADLDSRPEGWRAPTDGGAGVFFDPRNPEIARLTAQNEALEDRIKRLEARLNSNDNAPVGRPTTASEVPNMTPFAAQDQPQESRPTPPAQSAPTAPQIEHAPNPAAPTVTPSDTAPTQADTGEELP